MSVERIAQVFEMYSAWKEVEGVSETGQALHPAVLNNISGWDDNITPVIIARSMLELAGEKVILWMQDRKSLQSLGIEGGPYHARESLVANQIEKLLAFRQSR